MEQKILPVQNGTYQKAAQVLGRAFQDDPVPIAIFQGLPEIERVKRLTVGFTAEMNICVKQGIPLVVKDVDTIVAAAAIYPPGNYPISTIDQIAMLAKTIWGDGFYGLGRWLKWLSDMEIMHPKWPHYYLEFLGVEPEFQGKGFGSALLKFLTEKADSEHMGCYLENSNPRNNPLYQRFGFQIVGTEDIIGVRNWFMWRPPNRNTT